MAWIHGQNGGAPSASCERPHSTPKPSCRETRANSSAVRVLPMPGSPASMTMLPVPEDASASADRSAVISRCRPTRDMGFAAPRDHSGENPARFPTNVTVPAFPSTGTMW